ncbi:MAG: DJ-1/PfpI family protein [Parachlamydiales bacterium]
MQIVFLFYDGMTALDAIGPYEVLSRLPGAVTRIAALKAGPIKTCSSLNLLADSSLAEIDHADLLVVPGAGNATNLQKFPNILEWIRTIDATTTWTTSVCTGSLILGAAGLLSGHPATTHWAVMDRLAAYGAIAQHARVVFSGKMVTAAGVSAGIDMALTLAARIAGDSVAQALQLGLEYDPEPPFNTGSVSKASPALVEGLRSRLMTRFID